MSSQYFDEADKVEFLPSGSQLLDNVLGGGYAIGRVISIVGEYGSAKSLLALEACANHKKLFPNGKVRYCDVESALDLEYITKLGVCLTKEERKDIFTVEDLGNHLADFQENLPSDSHGLFIVDSLDALSTEAELEKTIDEKSYGTDKAKVMTALFRRLIQPMERKNITLIIISQTRDMIGSMIPMKTRSGGKALDFYSSQVVWINPLAKGKIEKTVSGTKEIIGIEIHIKNRKNKVSMPFRECNLKVLLGFGIDDIGSNLEWLSKNDGLDKVPKLDGISASSISAYSKKTFELSQEEFNKIRATIAQITKERWAEIEAQFAYIGPKKY